MEQPADMEVDYLVIVQSKNRYSVWRVIHGRLLPALQTLIQYTTIKGTKACLFKPTSNYHCNSFGYINVLQHSYNCLCGVWPPSHRLRSQILNSNTQTSNWLHKFVKITHAQECWVVLLPSCLYHEDPLNLATTPIAIQSLLAKIVFHFQLLFSIQTCQENLFA